MSAFAVVRDVARTITVIRLDATEDGSQRVDTTYQLGRAGEPVPLDASRPAGC